MGVASGCGEQEAGVDSGSGWYLWVWLVGMVVRRYIDFLILLIPTPLVSVRFCSSIRTFCSFFLMFFVLYIIYFTPSHSPSPSPSPLVLVQSITVKSCLFRRVTLYSVGRQSVLV